MSNNLSTLNGKNLSELAYLADKIGKLEGVKGEKLTDVFFESDGVTIRDNIKQDVQLNAFAEKAKDNEISSTNADEVLKGLTDAAETAANPLPDDLYTEEVLPNETLKEIAERHGLTEEDLRKVNPGLPADGKLKPFESIKIPNKKY